MAFESIFRKASAALAVSAYALCVGAAPVVHAQVLAMGKSTTIGSETLSGAIPERIVLHGLRFQANSDKIDKFSVPMLDYAIQIIKGNPEYLVYVRLRSVACHGDGLTSPWTLPPRSARAHDPPMASSPIDACLDDFSHLTALHGLFSHPSQYRVFPESPFVTDSEPRNLALSCHLVNRSRVNPQ